MDKFIGKTLNDRYILTEIVGVGGMAVVYKAFDKVVNRIVAVKILKEEYMSDAQFRRRFTNESKAITMLSQNNIVDVYDVCLEGDLMYLVMEYIDGITLKEYLDKVKILDWHEASFYIKQILKAMSHAHERGIVHRDIKPHNIMLLRDGTIKVTDFGIAKLTKFDTHTITDKAIGSVHYISPEQASGDRTDEKTDIYSVGVMFYEMLTGTLPFVGDSAVSVALMQVQAQPRLPREINANIPEGVEEITIKAMMKDPMARYSSALAMFNDIISVEENPQTVFGYLFSGEIVESDIPESTDDSPTIFTDINPLLNLEPTYAPEEQYEEQPEDNQDEEPQSAFKTTWLPIICGVLAAILIVVFVVWIIINWHELTDKDKGAAQPESQSQVNVPNMIVPDYINQNYKEVMANSPGIKFDPLPTTSELEKDIIVSQYPAANTEVPANTVITLYYSMGQETISVPDLTGMTRDNAIKELKKVGLDKYKIIENESDTIQSGRVIKTSPQGGEEATSDTQIRIYISIGSAQKTVPNVTNKAEQEAVRLIEEAGLKVEIKEAFDDKVEKGFVISQNPAADTKLEADSVVTLTVSKGPENPDKKPDDTENTGDPEDPGDKPMDEMITVPDITNDISEDAIKKITDAGLMVEVSYQNSNKVTKNYIISQSPAGGTSVTAGTTVQIVVSFGPASTTVKMPSIVGKSKSEAEKIITDLGLVVVFDEQYNDSVEAGVVVSQTISENSDVEKGSTVTVVISKGKENTQPPSDGGGEGENNPPPTEGSGTQTNP